MAEIIQIDFKRRCKVVPNPFFEKFLDLLRKHGICEDDISEVVDAINDPLYYETVEEDIKKLVKIYFENIVKF